MKQATILLVLLLGAFSCETTEPPPLTTTQIQLRAIDASCTEVWLEVKLPASIQPRTFSLRRDTSLVLSTTLVGVETLIVDEGLLPNRQYGYTATRAGEVATSGITTLDTTSHEFVWEIDTLGEGGLLDIAIINDTLAYAVGEIYLRDSTGQLDPVFYNLARWDGSIWQFSRIKSNCRFYYPNCGPETLTVAPGRSVFAFGPNDVWIAAGGLHRFTGSQWIEQRAVLEVGVANKIWGANAQDLWLVGNDGLIVHYNGSSWQRLESGTTLHVYDVYGNGSEVLAVAAEQFVSSNRRILRVSQQGIDSIPSTNIPSSLHGLWFTNRAYYVVGGGMYTAQSISPSTMWRALTPFVTNYYIYAINGRAKNNIVACGAFGEVLHFNGASWRSYRNLVPLSAGSYRGIGLTDRICLAAGSDSPRATIAVGKRTN